MGFILHGPKTYHLSKQNIITTEGPLDIDLDTHNGPHLINSNGHPMTNPELGENQASSVATTEQSTGNRSCRRDQATQKVKPAKATGNESSINDMEVELDSELNNSNTKILQDIPAISENIITMEPYENNLNYKPKPSTKPKTSNQDKFQQLFGPVKFTKFYSIKSTGEADLTKLNMFKVDKAIKQLIGTCEKISEDYQNKGWTIEIKNEKQGQQILQLKTLLTEEVTVTPHRRFNESQGVITCALLKGYSDDEIVEGLSESGVVRCHRIIKGVNSPNPEPTSTLILTFNSSNPPERICIRTGLQERVRPYIPLPRRCHNCQRYGHSTLKCRFITPVCDRCSGDFNDNHNSTNCERTPFCLHCNENHLLSSRTCSKYLLEKEVLAIKTREHLTFPEARAKASLNFNHTNKSFASQLETTNTSPIPTIPVQPRKPPSNNRNAALQRSDINNNQMSNETEKVTINHREPNCNPLNAIQSNYDSPNSRPKRQLSDNSPKPRNKSPKRHRPRPSEEGRRDSSQEWTHVNRKQRSRSRPTTRYISKDRTDHHQSSIDNSPDRNKPKPQHCKNLSNTRSHDKPKTDHSNK